MTDFLIKSTVAMTVLLAIYHLVFENEKIHRFNRFYLLGALLFSLVVPFINLSTDTPSVLGSASVTLEELFIGNSSVVAVAPEKVNYTSFLWVAYSFVSGLLLARFVKNIVYFLKKVNSNEMLSLGNAKLILLNEIVLPHTFFNCIFINKTQFEQNVIERELFTHELAHINQKHTLDIIFIELLKVIFWINPVLYMYKKAIQLNHEFLADEKVISVHKNVVPYQNLLLTKANNAHAFALASNLNFLVTKKRLLMMTKHTSQVMAIVKKTIVLPVLAGVVFITYSHATTLKELKKEIIPTKSIDPLLKVQAQDNDNIIDDIQSATGNELPKPRKRDTVKDVVNNLSELTKQPEYPGGMLAFYQYVNKNFKIPEDATGSLKIYISFIIEKNGSISNVKVLRSPFEELGKEAIRVVSGSKKWSPGEIKNKKVRTSYNLPITIHIAEATEKFTAFDEIDSDKVKKVEVNQLTEEEKNTLKNLDPDKYNDETLKEYKAIKVTYINDKGELVSKTAYRNK